MNTDIIPLKILLEQRVDLTGSDNTLLSMLVLANGYERKTRPFIVKLDIMQKKLFIIFSNNYYALDRLLDATNSLNLVVLNVNAE